VGVPDNKKFTFPERKGSNSIVSGFHYKIISQLRPDYSAELSDKVLYETFKQYPDTILLTGAPVTGIATFLKKHPDIIIKKWVAQGGFAGTNLVAKEGIKKIDAVDSRKIRKIKKVEKKKDPKTGVDVVAKVDEFYLYNERGIEASSVTGVKLSVDSVVFVPSGVYDQNSLMVLSHLHKAIKPANQLKMLGDVLLCFELW
jgi:hypothetical protein